MPRARTVYERFGTTANPAPTLVVRRHLVIAAETVPSIASTEYGIGYDSKAWRRIAEYNEIDDILDVMAGDVLKIPPLESET